VAVPIMNDGERNCETDTVNVISMVSSWAAKGIKSHLVGLPGSEAASSLRRAALRGREKRPVRVGSFYFWLCRGADFNRVGVRISIC
jgi:hypothetical protein